MESVMAAARPAAAYHLQRFRTKLASGQYRQEAVHCFCGHWTGPVVVEQDRYGLPYRVVLCDHCGLLYANPRLDIASTLRFYQEDYRPIYDDGVDRVATKLHMQDLSITLRDFLDQQFDYQPTCVLDIGCDQGGWLHGFAEAGAAVHGVEIGEPWPDVQPDLVILHHVLEHMTDLRGELQHIHDILAPNGKVFVSVPGLFTWKLDQLWQSAHTYQFVGDTLTYVMECSGFQELYLDEGINSLWEKRPCQRALDEVPARVPRRIQAFLAGQPLPAPLLRCFNKFPIRERKAAIAHAVSLGLPDVAALAGCHEKRRAIIVGGGPSVDGFLEQIKLQQANGALVFVIERMLGWAQQHDLRVDYVVCMDASADTSESLAVAQPGSTYLMASQCIAEAFAAVSGLQVYLFHTPQHGIDQRVIWQEAGGTASPWDTVVNSAGSVTLGSMSLAMTLGCTRLEVYGFDGHLGNGAYAQGIRGVGTDPVHMRVTVGEREFLTTPSYLAFAQQFFQLVEFGKRHAGLERVTVHGDALVNAMKVDANAVMR